MVIYLAVTHFEMSPPLPWRRRKYVPSNLRHKCTKLYGVTFQTSVATMGLS